MTISLYICEDNFEYARNLQTYLPKMGDFKFVGKAANGEQAVQDEALYQADLLLLDLEMPVKDGIWVIEKLAVKNKKPEILVLTSFKSEKKVFIAIKKGASGYLVKGESLKIIIKAIEDILQGGVVIDSSLAARFWRLFNASLGKCDEVPWALTIEELDILTFVAKGLSNPEVGKIMGYSRTKVKKLLHSIYTKLGVNSRVEAVILALKAGLIEL
ncbi:MAG: response regulator transcription factor [Deltaproteobacteria bacterium]|jgi:two-component system response regulator DegU|nr:response regulator transcription factor [Deltaproteobacteria bacterium]